MRISFSKTPQILELDTVYPQSCINQGEKWQNAAEFYLGHCNSTMIDYDEPHVTKIRPISEVACGWPWNANETRKVNECPQYWSGEATSPCESLSIPTDGHARSRICLSTQNQKCSIPLGEIWTLSVVPWTPQVGISIDSAVFVWSTNKSDRPTDRQTDHATCSVTMRATRKKNGIILQQLRFVRALTVNLSCQSTADTSVDVCGEVMSSDSNLFRFGCAAATHRQASVHQRDVGFDALFNIPKLLMQNLIAVFHDTIRYEMLFNVRSKANMSQLNLPHGTDN